ncbi:2-hydroxyacid dehydrogenase [Virgibacillus xinjiangensis]|uniref:2-hydroxyacid dehydrogenase n=1 Tax=Virgibacillus xinjiangensis TaxID=393090 RepID=A0ABV7CYT7_9BACI
MAEPLIYVTRRIPDSYLEPYQDRFHFECWEKEEEPVPREVLLERAQHADGLLSMVSDRIDGELLAHASQLKVVSNLAVGYDNIDIIEAKKRGITVTNTPDVLTDTTADLAFALLMATARKVLEASDFVKENQWKNWSPFLLAGSDIHHKTIGIVGMGRIGEAIARRAKGFDMDVIYHNRTRKQDVEEKLPAEYRGFEQLLQEADYVVSVVPLTEETTKLFDERAFKYMKETSIFINVSRGAVVDEAALERALKQKEISAAGLDVFTNEPIDNKHPLVALENCICLPHIGSASLETRGQMIELCLENLTAVLGGESAKTPVTQA